MERTVEMPVGVVVERRAIDHPWQKWRWRPVAVIPGAPPVERWRTLLRGDGWERFHAATLPLQLHRKETEAYRVNLSNRPPVVYAVLRDREDGADPERPYEVARVTASPFEAQDYLDSGEDLVEGVPMPDELIAWVRAFVERHHVDEPFRKRRRARAVEEDHGPEFGRRPPVAAGRGGDGRGGRGFG